MKPALLFFCCALTLPAMAQDCRSVLGPQTADAASLQKVEDRWNEAFLRGKVEYLDCLLSPDYASVSPKGIHDKKWELETAAKHKGDSTPIPDVPGVTFEVHGSTGIMRVHKEASADGKYPAQYMADVFTFQDGAWRAIYSQHTTAEKQ